MMKTGKIHSQITLPSIILPYRCNTVPRIGEAHKMMGIRIGRIIDGRMMKTGKIHS